MLSPLIQLLLGARYPQGIFPCFTSKIELGFFFWSHAVHPVLVLWSTDNTGSQFLWNLVIEPFFHPCFLLRLCNRSTGYVWGRSGLLCSFLKGFSPWNFVGLGGTLVYPLWWFTWTLHEGSFEQHCLHGYSRRFRETDYFSLGQYDALGYSSLYYALRWFVRVTWTPSLPMTE